MGRESLQNMVEIEESKLPSICVGVNVVDALLLIGLGIWTIIQNTSDASRFLISIYVIVFAGVLMLAQFELSWLQAEFSFLNSYFGRSVFALFIGTLCIGLKLLGFLTGAVTCLVAFFNMWMYCKFGDQAPTLAPSGEGGLADGGAAYGTGNNFTSNNSTSYRDGGNYTPSSQVINKF